MGADELRVVVADMPSASTKAVRDCRAMSAAKKRVVKAYKAT